MRIRLKRLMFLTVLCLAPCWGCGSVAERQLAELIPVKGKVTYKGQPLTKGSVEFEPRDFGRSASGDLQPDGTFVLGTLKEGDGVVAGHHRVFVTGTGIPGKTAKKSKELVPAKYTQPATSGLTADVDKEHTEFTFELKDGR
jgi:hypothetical protein